MAFLVAAALLAACGGDDDGGGGDAAEPTYEEVKAAVLSMPEVQGQCDQMEESEDITRVGEDLLPDHRRLTAIYCPDAGKPFDYTEFETAVGASDAVDLRKPIRPIRGGRKRELYTGYFINDNVLVVPGPIEDAEGRPIPAADIARTIQRRCGCGEVRLEPLI